MNLLISKGLKGGTVERTLRNYPTPDAAEAAMYYEAWYAVSAATNVEGIICVTMDDTWHEDKRVEWTRNATPAIESTEEETE